MTARRNPQRGAALVEFALVLFILLGLVIGAVEMGRAMFQWSSAVDATRRGARTAAIVAMNDTTSIRDAMLLDMSGLQAAVVTVEYSADGSFPGSCSGRGSCQFVRVSVTYTFTPLVPFPAITMPSFATTLPVEALGAT